MAFFIIFTLFFFLEINVLQEEIYFLPSHQIMNWTVYYILMVQTWCVNAFDANSRNVNRISEPKTDRMFAVYCWIECQKWGIRFQYICKSDKFVLLRLFVIHHLRMYIRNLRRRTTFYSTISSSFLCYDNIFVVIVAWILNFVDGNWINRFWWFSSGRRTMNNVNHCSE